MIQSLPTLFLILLALCRLHARSLDKVVVYGLDTDSDQMWSTLMRSWKTFKPCREKMVDLEIYTLKKNIQVGNHEGCFKSISIKVPPIHQKSHEMERLIFEK